MRKVVLLVAAVLPLAFAAAVSAHPDEKGEVYVPWMDRVSGERLTRSTPTPGTTTASGSWTSAVTSRA